MPPSSRAGRAIVMSEETLPVLASSAPEQSSLPPEEKRRRLVELVVNSVPSQTSQRVYRMGVEQFFDWWGASAAAGEAFSRSLMQRYRVSLEARALAPRTINLRLAAVRKLAEEAAAQELLPETKVSEICSVKGAKVLGTRAGNWLTRAQAEKRLTLPDIETLKGKRDRALLAQFVSAGLLREELASLLRDQMQQRDRRWCLVDLVGKGGRVRTVAIPDWTQQAVALWLEAMPMKEGPVLGKVNKGGRFVGAGMSAPSIYSVVVEYAERLGIEFRPHDLRRTYGKLAHKGGAKIEPIQLSYGHASLTTTERYLGIEQDLEDAPCDHLGLSTT
jgi:site-specific recombinase XerD